MIINGLQKTTLLDFPGKVACTVFTSGCNFRCPFCHNASLVLNEGDVGVISEDEFFKYIEKRRGILDGVAITGGEPLMAKGIVEFMRKIRSMGFLIKLDTNGSFPDRLSAILEEGLVDYVAMDVKNCAEKYAATAGIDHFPGSVDKSIDIIMSKAPDYEFRTTVVKELHEKSDILKIAERLKNAKHYYLQSYVDSGDILGGEFSAYSQPEMLDILGDVRKILPDTELRGI